MDLFDTLSHTGLGEEAGLDPNLYEDIPKQPIFNTTSSANYVDYWAEKSQFAGLQDSSQGVLFPADDVGDALLDSLLDENCELVDQLIAASDIDLSSGYIDLEAIDELDMAVKSSGIISNDTYMFNEHCDDLLSAYDSLSQLPGLEDAYPAPDSPLSSISTLPSEPSSPLDISSMLLDQQQVNTQQSPADSLPAEPDLDNLLESLNDSVFYNFDSPAAATAGGDFVESVNHNVIDSSFFSGGTADDAADDSFSYQDSLASSPADSGRAESPVSHSAKVKNSKKKKKFTPYSKLPAGRKERKKQQNKEAAIRYREKKRSEAQNSLNEETMLANRNTELKTQVTNLEREILCMKELLSDVFNIHSL